jgi:hypothetical protein
MEGEKLPLNSATADYVGLNLLQDKDEPIEIRPLSKFEWVFGRDFQFFLDLITDHTCSRLRNALMVDLHFLVFLFPIL